jgi:hypothetical protein
MGSRVALRLRDKMRRRRYEVVIFAGKVYAEPVARFITLLDPKISVTTPLDGLAIGHQLRWFRCAADRREGRP